MSHFVVLVLGGTPETIDEYLEKTLEPYNENTPVAPYWEEEATNAQDHWAWSYTEEAVVPIATMVEYAEFLNKRYSEDGYKYRVRDGVLQRQSTYNPESKWDWWVVGGRWSNMLMLKDGRHVDEAYIRDVDWVGMRAVARKKAEDDFDLMWNIIGKRTPLVAWKSFMAKYPNDIAKAREEYNAQETLKVLRSSNVAAPVFGCPVETYHLDAPNPRESFVEASVNAIPWCYAVVKDGKWVTQGSMGWWGMSKDDMTDDEWKAIVRKLIDDSPDEYVTVVDCHI
jgi:hypothetical protein